MPTVNNVYALNQVNANITVGPPQVFNTVWEITRALKKAGYKYMASGDGTTKNTSADPQADLWGNAGTTSNPGAGAASITANTRGRATVTGLSGITSADKGRFLQISGSGSGNNGYHQIEEILSASSVKIDARRVTITSPDANNGALTWTIQDPLGTVYPSALDSVAAWWCGRGPSILRVPITAAPVVGPGGFTFLRGENITQATTGFEGEILGFVQEASTGYLVVAPRLRGTGGGVFGLATGNAFTGASSGATVTQNGTALEYRYEVVIWKAANTTSGLIFFTQPEPVAEGAANLFSSLATSAGCTATVAPGGGGTGNTFPTLAWVAMGAGTTVASAVAWSGNTGSIVPHGNSQIVAVDCIEEQNYSADGSWFWTIACFNATGPTGGGHKVMSFQRLDDIEDGELSPYVSFCSAQTKTLYANTRTNAGGSEGSNPMATDACSLNSVVSNGTGRVMLNGWFRRGLSSERFQEFEFAALYASQSTAGTVFLTRMNPGQADLIGTALSPTVLREPLWVIAIATGQKTRKGTLRWVYHVGPGGHIGRFYDNKRWVQMSSDTGAFIFGPWDGTTNLLVS